MLDAVAAAIAAHGLLAPGEPVLVGLSGGPDSVALVHALVRLGHAVTAAHLDHAWRTESAQDAAWVAERCAGWGVPLVSERQTVDAGEDAGRLARYEFLTRVARQTNLAAIATAHHADDQVETVLFRLGRGAGPAGLSGMAPGRALDGDLRLVRPLLGVRRAEIEELLATWSLDALDDPSNRDPRYARNAIRHSVLPLLESINTGASVHILDLAKLMRDEAAAGQERARAIAKHAVYGLAPGLLEVDRQVLRDLPPADARWLVREVLDRLGGGASDVQTVEKVREVAGAGGAAHLPGGVQVTAAGPWLVLYRAAARPAPAGYVGEGLQPTAAWGWKVEVGCPTDQIATPASVRFDAGKLPRDLIWRCAAPDEDSFWPWGASGPRGLHAFLTRQGIPAHRQDTLLVLASGKTVVWLVGIRRSSLAPATHASTEVVEMQATAGFPV